jgi:hypothetical protein
MQRYFFYIIFLMGFGAFAQGLDSITSQYKAKIEELKELQYKVFYSKKEVERFAANRDFLKAIESIATMPQAMRFPFDSLHDISSLSPKDKKFILLTWNIPRDDETHLFFGFLLVNNTKKIKKGMFKYEITQNYEYFKFTDKSPSVKNPETYIGTPDKWYGMLYYELIECEDYYTLLGWDGNDKLVQRKYIDALYFKSDGTPVFGRDVFKFPRKNPKRLMFEYSSEVTMSLKYNDKAKRIVYSHLAPREEGPVMEGLYQYYGPDGSYDSMVQKKGKWVIVEDVDARNDKNKNDKAIKPDPDKQTPIFTPK